MRELTTVRYTDVSRTEPMTDVDIAELQQADARALKDLAEAMVWVKGSEPGGVFGVVEYAIGVVAKRIAERWAD